VIRTITFGIIVLMGFAGIMVACTGETIPSQKSRLSNDTQLVSRGLSEWSAPHQVGGDTLSAGNAGYLQGPVVSSAADGYDLLAWNLYQGSDDPLAAFSQRITTVQFDRITAQTRTYEFLPAQHSTQTTLPQLRFDPVTNLTSALWIFNGVLFMMRDISVAGNPTPLGLAQEAWDVDGQYVWWTKTSTGIEIYTNKEAGIRDRLVRAGAAQAMFATPKRFSATTVLLNWMEVDDFGVRRFFGVAIDGSSAQPFGSVQEIRNPKIANSDIASMQTFVSTPMIRADFFVQYSDAVLGDAVASVRYTGTQWEFFSYVTGLEPTPDRGIRGPIKLAGGSIGFVLAYIEELTNADTITSNIKTISNFGKWGVPTAHGVPMVRSIDPKAVNAEYATYLDLAYNLSYVLVWVENRGNTSELKSEHTDKSIGWSSPETIVAYSNNGFVESPTLAFSRNQVADIYWKHAQPSNSAIVFDIKYSTTTVTLAAPFVATPSTPIVVTPGSTKPANHLPTSDNCAACHFPDRSILVSHADVVGMCGDCHDDVLASGKLISHVPSTNVCDACHITNYWNPIITFDHSQLLSFCVDCHNGIDAPGKGSLHLNTTMICEACHFITSWMPAATVDHADVFGVCSSCHNNNIAKGLSPTHIPIIEECDGCHYTDVWIPVKQTEPTPGLPPAHIATTGNCAACHAVTSWIPVIRVDHREVIGTCNSCHNGVVATGKPVNHVPASNSCERCHGTGAWLPATGGGL